MNNIKYLKFVYLYLKNDVIFLKKKEVNIVLIIIY